MEVLLVGLDVFGEVLDLFREDSNLDADVTGVLFVSTKLSGEFCSLFFCDSSHFKPFLFFDCLFHYMFLSEFTALAPVELANLVTGPRQKCNLDSYIVKIVVSGWWLVVRFAVKKHLKKGGWAMGSVAYGSLWGMGYGVATR